jgi:hypothetical protein
MREGKFCRRASKAKGWIIVLYIYIHYLYIFIFIVSPNAMLTQKTLAGPDQLRILNLPRKTLRVQIYSLGACSLVNRSFIRASDHRRSNIAI